MYSRLSKRIIKRPYCINITMLGKSCLKIQINVLYGKGIVTDSEYVTEYFKEINYKNLNFDFYNKVSLED